MQKNKKYSANQISFCLIAEKTNCTVAMNPQSLLCEEIRTEL